MSSDSAQDHDHDIDMSAVISAQCPSPWITHDNGGRPFQVYHDQAAREVRVFARIISSDCVADRQMISYATEPICVIKNVARVFLDIKADGESPMPGYDDVPGSSVLVRDDSGTCYWIGDRILQFELAHGDHIVKYRAPLIGSDVVSAWIIGRDNVYLLCDRRMCVPLYIWSMLTNSREFSRYDPYLNLAYGPYFNLTNSERALPPDLLDRIIVEKETLRGLYERSICKHIRTHYKLEVKTIVERTL